MFLKTNTPILLALVLLVATAPFSMPQGTNVYTAGANVTSLPADISVSVPLLAADAANREVFICDRAYKILAVREAHSVVGGSSAALTPEKLTGTTAPGSGTALISAAIDLTATVNTVVSGTMATSSATVRCAVGDRIGFKESGTLTGLLGVATISLQRL